MLMLMSIFLCCYRICVVCLVLELLGSWVVVGFGGRLWRLLDEFLSINVPWSQAFSCVLRFWT